MRVTPIQSQAYNFKSQEINPTQENISIPEEVPAEIEATTLPEPLPAAENKTASTANVLLGLGLLASLGVAGAALYKNKNIKKEITSLKDKLSNSEKTTEELKTKLKEAEAKADKAKETKKNTPVSQTNRQNVDITGLKKRNNILTNENNLLRSQIEELKNNLQEKTTGFLEKVKKVLMKNTNEKVQTAQAVKPPKKPATLEEAVQAFNKLTKKDQKQVIAKLKKLLNEKLKTMQKKAKEPVNIKEQHVIIQPAKTKETKTDIRELKQNSPEYTFKNKFDFGKKLIRRIQTKYYELVTDYRLKKAQKKLQAEIKRQDLQYRVAVQESDLRNEQWLEQQHKIKEQEYNEIFKDIPMQPGRIKRFLNKLNEFVKVLLGDEKFSEY